jgi:hypothetical protein
MNNDIKTNHRRIFDLLDARDISDPRLKEQVAIAQTAYLQEFDERLPSTQGKPVAIKELADDIIRKAENSLPPRFKQMKDAQANSQKSAQQKEQDKKDYKRIKFNIVTKQQAGEITDAEARKQLVDLEIKYGDKIKD